MKTDVIIIGSGQAGVPLSVKLVQEGKRVLLVEREQPGGTCVNTGCTPTKTMIASARAAHVARTAARLGVHAVVRVDLEEVVRRKDDIVRRWRDGVMHKLRDAGERLTFLHGHARFVAERAIEVAGQRYEAPIVVINVGARPLVPAIPGLDAVAWLDNRRAMELTKPPRHLVAIGGGYIGCELAQMFRRFGSDVTIVDSATHLMSQEDPEISDALADVFRAEGIWLELGASVQQVSGREDKVVVRLAGGKEIQGTHLLVATGRRPNTDDLGCERAGIRLDARGFVGIDDRYRTSAQGIYAVGDATPEPQFTHVAWDDHRLLFDLIMERSHRGRSARVYPRATFTDPQVAGVGLTEKEAKEQGVAYESATMPFGEIARAIEVDEPAGILKVLIAPESGRVVGAAIVGAEAAELVHVFIALMQAQASARAIDDAEFIHPTFAEGIQSVVMRLTRLARA
jgi:pyruvate/2-oxoglutarate dehydrogenase complex dihydrolipoamide dehydrogenase (E3) component